MSRENYVVVTNSYRLYSVFDNIFEFNLILLHVYLTVTEDGSKLEPRRTKLTIF